MARRTYTAEFKSSAAQLVAHQGYSALQAAKSLGVNPATIRAWVRLHASSATGSAKGAGDPAALHAENQRLRDENRRLLMEREILKKAAAFFAREQP